MPVGEGLRGWLRRRRLHVGAGTGRRRRAIAIDSLLGSADSRGNKGGCAVIGNRARWGWAAVLVLSIGACNSSATTSTAPGSSAQPVRPPTRSVVAALSTETSDLALSGIDAATATRYVEAAVADPWVIETLGSDRADPVEVVDYGDGKSGVAVFIYDYTASKALNVGFAPEGLDIIRRTETLDQPSFSPREVARARELVDASDLVIEKAAGTKYVVWNVTGGHSGAFDGHRVLAVFLAPDGGSVDDRLIAYADLSAGAVIQVDEPSKR